MASIVYDGVGGGGTVFQDMKFFILQKVPMRPRWEELIKLNGGRVEKFEKNAAILIADDARKDTPPGSVSWRFIEESAKAGKLADIEEYRCRAPVVANGGVKTTRTPFTAADERLLTRWVLEAERRGRPTKGNQIYMELAAQFPHHTYQSWLDHWKSNLLPRYKAGNLHYATEDGDSPFPEREPRPVRRAPAKPPAAQSSHGRVKAGVSEERVPVADSSSFSTKSSPRRSLPAVSQSSSLKVRSGIPIAGRPFTEENNILLRGAFKEICEVDSDKEIEAWETWTERYGDHTAQEWRNYFHNEFCPQELSNREKKRQEILKPVLSAASQLSSSLQKDKYTKKTKTATPTKHFTHQVEKSSSEDVVKSPIAPPESKTSEATSPEIGLEKRPYTNDLLKDEVYFKHTLKQFWEPVGDVDFSPKICGKEISLFKLWQIVMLFGGFKKTNAKNRWLEAADKLCFPIANRPEAVEDLNKCYDEVLFDFEISIDDAKNDKNNPEFSAYREETLIASQLEEITSHGVQRSPEIEEETGNNDGVLELPPLSKSKHQLTVSTKKRAISSDEFLSRSGPSEARVKPQSKRRKIEKGKGKEVEIPSTPEHIFNATQPAISRDTSLLKYPPDEGDDASSSDQEARESIGQIQQNKPEGSSRKASVKKAIASPTPAPKKMTAGPVIIDSSKESSTDSDSESESESGSESKPQEQLQPLPKSKPRLESKSKSEPQSESPLEPEPESNSQASAEDEIDKFKALGYSDEIIVAALDATTMDYEIASVVMEKLKMGHSIPDNMAGVWTKKDDDALILKEGWKGFKRIRAKHGTERITARKEFKGIH